MLMLHQRDELKSIQQFFDRENGLAELQEARALLY